VGDAVIGAEYGGAQPANAGYEMVFRMQAAHANAQCFRMRVLEWPAGSLATVIDSYLARSTSLPRGLCEIPDLGQINLLPTLKLHGFSQLELG